MSNIVNNLSEIIGRTPLIRLCHISQETGAEVVGKLELANPGSSVKDRPALAMILQAEQDGALHKGSTIIEPTSGNTGIGLAWIAAARGYRVILVMPDSTSTEHGNLLKAFGARVILTPRKDGMKGAIDRAVELADATENSFLPQQFLNPANPACHARTTAEEIWDDCSGELACFVAGVGTGGTITGVGRVLKERNPDIRIAAVEPSASPVLSGGTPSLHPIQGLGAGFVPEILDTGIYDEVIQVSNENAFATAARLAREEGILAGISSGANVWAAAQIAKRVEYNGKRIVTLLCDTGERYLSSGAYDRNAPAE